MNASYALLWKLLNKEYDTDLSANALTGISNKGMPKEALTGSCTAAHHKPSTLSIQTGNISPVRVIQPIMLTSCSSMSPLLGRTESSFGWMAANPSAEDKLFDSLLKPSSGRKD